MIMMMMMVIDRIMMVMVMVMVMVIVIQERKGIMSGPLVGVALLGRTMNIKSQGITKIKWNITFD